MKRLVGVLLVLAYIFALIMSAGHLSEWYSLTLGTLPEWYAVGLAVALEAAAFLLSLVSNSYLRSSIWAKWGAIIALALVWIGNYLSMVRAGQANAISAWEAGLMSLFVPVSTYLVAKVLGELIPEPEPVQAVEHRTLPAEQRAFPTPHQPVPPVPVDKKEEPTPLSTTPRNTPDHEYSPYRETRGPEVRTPVEHPAEHPLPRVVEKRGVNPTPRTLNGESAVVRMVPPRSESTLSEEQTHLRKQEKLKQRLNELLEQGYSIRKAANALGIPSSTAHRWAKEAEEARQR